MKQIVKVYVAGAYSDDNMLGVMANIGRGEYYAWKLFKEGYAPFTPWHDRDFMIRSWEAGVSVEELQAYSLEWLKVSDCMFVVPNHEGLRKWEDSEGTKKEIQEARALGIPVFYSLEELYRIYPT